MHRRRRRCSLISLLTTTAATTERCNRAEIRNAGGEGEGHCTARLFGKGRCGGLGRWPGKARQGLSLPACSLHSAVPCLPGALAVKNTGDAAADNDSMDCDVFAIRGVLHNRQSIMRLFRIQVQELGLGRGSTLGKMLQQFVQLSFAKLALGRNLGRIFY